MLNCIVLLLQIRETEAAVELGGHTLPAGTKVALNILGMHHDPNNFPDPQTFKPERFMDGPLGPSSRHPYAFIPFGAGPRKCIGHRYDATTSVTVCVIIHVWQHP